VGRLATATTLPVRFAGGLSRSGPVTLGQRNVLMWIGEQTVERSDILFRFLDVPPNAAMADIATALSELLVRHESLRTLYRIDPDGEPTQLVLGSGVLDVEVHDAREEGEELESVLKDRLSAKYFAVTEDLPIRVAVVTHHGAPFLVALACSHAVVDYAGMEIVSRQLTHLLANPTSTIDGSSRQPLDQAEREHSIPGKRRAEAALRYWQTELLRRPQCVFSVPADPTAPPRYREALLCSGASWLALTRIVARTGISHSTTLLAAAATLLMVRTGNEAGNLVAICGNRFQPSLRDYVGTIAQDALVSFELGHSFDDTMRRANRAAMNAYRFGQFDAARLWSILDEVAELRGTRFHRDCVVNDLVVHRDLTPIPTTTTCAPEEPAQATKDTTFEFVPEVFVPVPFFFTVLQVRPEVRLGLYADTRYLPEGEMEALLRGVERLLVAAAAEDVPRDRISAVSGVNPVRRGEDWARIDHCWIELPKVQRMLTEVLDGAPSHVATELGEGGEPTLVAYIVPGTRTPEEIHAACMAALVGRYTLMAPQEYALCETPPNDRTNTQEWQRQVVTRTKGRLPRRQASAGDESHPGRDVN
jgi:condensation domain-containing protein